MTFMSEQIEREDLLAIYLPHPQDVGALTRAEQDALINQADQRLKCEKGKAYLPRLTKENVIELFKDLSRDSQGRLSFHDAQKVIFNYRQQLVKDYKLVFPPLKTRVEQIIVKQSKPFIKSKPRKHIISDAVAPLTMFQKNHGQNHNEITETTMKALSRHAFKIIPADAAASNVDITSNIRLLREMKPNTESLAPRQISSSRYTLWNEKEIWRGSGLGSQVSTVPSSTTWQRQYTLY